VNGRFSCPTKWRRRHDDRKLLTNDVTVFLSIPYEHYCQFPSKGFYLCVESRPVNTNTTLHLCLTSKFNTVTDDIIINVVFYH